jgi:hypothetical protein
VISSGSPPSAGTRHKPLDTLVPNTSSLADVHVNPFRNPLGTFAIVVAGPPETATRFIVASDWSLKAIHAPSGEKAGVYPVATPAESTVVSMESSARVTRASR